MIRYFQPPKVETSNTFNCFWASITCSVVSTFCLFHGLGTFNSTFSGLVVRYSNAYCSQQYAMHTAMIDCELNNGKFLKQNALENSQATCLPHYSYFIGTFTSSDLVSLEMANRKKQTYLSIKDKTEILDYLKRGQSAASLAKKYGVVKSTISKLKKNEAKLKKFVEHSDIVPSNRKTLRPSEYPLMEEHLYRWITKKRSENVPISTQIVLEQAKFYHSKYEHGEFNGSLGWFAKFKVRHGIRYLKICGEKLSTAPELIEPFVKELKEYISANGLLKSQIYNADESALFWKMLPNKTLAMGMERAIDGRKVLKQRITFMPCSNATGEHKMKLLAIGKSKNPRAIKNAVIEIDYASSQRGWMTSNLFTNWFQHKFVPEVHTYAYG